ncbi:hypothetical protein KVH07_07030 [Streptomyces olivaceus]|nr:MULTISPECIES: hypothetical protein [Streptomyces]MBZ6192685.1 hypothetical protein [Streptomyces olivaceus]MBZ6289396.1 hypothetical protein [Streptomyces olivaceus]MBZ6326415.1 hypothetical protein [Streptomyces olivaceus]MCC2265233.1 hypothetical protein [Streptomyces sp. CT1-17]
MARPGPSVADEGPHAGTLPPALTSPATTELAVELPLSQAKPRTTRR